MNRLLVSLATFSLGSLAGWSASMEQARPKLVEYVPAERFEEARDRVVRERAVGTTVYTSDDDQVTYTFVRRTVPSDIEEHSRWDDVVIVQRGAGVLVFGQETRGATVRAPGELIGGTFQKSYDLPLKSGDMARVPAGIPHAFRSSGTEPFEYVLLKVRRPNLPLKRKADD